MLKTILDSLMVIVGTLLLAVWLSAPDAQADEPKTITQRLRDEFACPGMHAEWLDDKTAQCLKERPYFDIHKTSPKKVLTSLFFIAPKYRQ